MTLRALNIREAFLLASALRGVIYQFGYFRYNDDKIHGETVVNVRDILKLCEELEGL